MPTPIPFADDGDTRAWRGRHAAPPAPRFQSGRDTASAGVDDSDVLDVLRGRHGTTAGATIALVPRYRSSHWWVWLGCDRAGGAGASYGRVAQLEFALAMGNASAESSVWSLAGTANRIPNIPAFLEFYTGSNRCTALVVQKLGMNDVEPRRPVAPCCALPVAGASTFR